MAEIINLGKARKARAKADDKARAAENRARFGRTGADKALERARKDKIDRTLDGAKLDASTPEKD
jgi:hypothetical protein